MLSALQISVDPHRQRYVNLNVVERLLEQYFGVD